MKNETSELLNSLKTITLMEKARKEQEELSERAIKIPMYVDQFYKQLTTDFLFQYAKNGEHSCSWNPFRFIPSCQKEKLYEVGKYYNEIGEGVAKKLREDGLKVEVTKLFDMYKGQIDLTISWK